MSQFFHSIADSVCHWNGADARAHDDLPCIKVHDMMASTGVWAWTEADRIQCTFNGVILVGPVKVGLDTFAKDTFQMFVVIQFWFTHDCAGTEFQLSLRFASSMSASIITVGTHLKGV